MNRDFTFAVVAVLHYIVRTTNSMRIAVGLASMMKYPVRSEDCQIRTVDEPKLFVPTVVPISDMFL